VKKQLILIVASGSIAFGGAFAAGWLTKPAAAVADGAAGPGSPAPANLSPLQALAATTSASDEDAAARAMTEQQLKDLIYQIREKMKEYDEKVKSLDKERERLNIAGQTLKKDIETLNALRVDLAAAVASAKNERDVLLKTRVQVDQVEKANLLAIAAAYDKMDAASAGDILVNMATGQSRTGATARSANLDDAVKILHFMQERTKAKVLAEIVAKEPALAAVLCQKLKQVQEGK